MAFVNLLQFGQVEPAKIPLTVKEYWFRVTHKLVNYKQVENIYYVKGKNSYVRILLIDKTRKKKHPHVDKSSYFITQNEPVRLLNYAGFMNMMEKYPSIPPSKIDTITEFEFIYKTKAGNIKKKVVVYNIDDLCQNPRNRNALMLKVIMLYTEKTKYFIYDGFLSSLK